MKYCVEYERGKGQEMKEVDEINITFRREDTTLFDFLLLHKSQRVNIFIDDEDDFIDNHCEQLFAAFVDEDISLTFKLVLRSYRSEKTQEVYKLICTQPLLRRKYYFYDFVKDWDTLWGLAKLKVSDMYIVENLGFELDKVSSVLHSRGIRVRVFPNIAQSACDSTPDIYKFFLRPEDIPYYEKFVDTCEFIGRKKSQMTYYRIYSKDQKWFGNLRELILDFDTDLDSRHIVPIAMERRAKCGKRCFKGTPCNICKNMADAEKTLKNKGIIFQYEKRKEQEEE